MKPTVLFISFLLFTQLVIAQKADPNKYAAIDKKALQMPDSLTRNTDGMAAYVKANFTNERDNARAVFIWVASKIDYDVANMFALNFYEKKEDKIAKPLQTRKGICENYAALFTDVCSKAGIRSYVVEGYTKQNGFADYLPHAWCAACVDSVWYMFDPTWGSGYISGGKFVRRVNNDYFMANPSSMVRSHMPFDYLWQFLSYPVTNQQFYEGHTQADPSKPIFSYKDSIRVWEQQNHTQQLEASAARIEKNGVKNSLIFDRLQHIKLELENERENRKVTLYNTAVAQYNDAINDFYEFIQYRNKQFTPKKTDPEIQRMLDMPTNKLNDAKAKLTEIKGADANTATLVVQLTKSIDDVFVHVKDQQDWLKTYFSKGKVGRKSMFYKYTWMGIPLN